MERLAEGAVQRRIEKDKERDRTLLTVRRLLLETLDYLDMLATGVEIDWAYSGQEPQGYLIEMDNNIAEKGGAQAIRDLIEEAHVALGLEGPKRTTQARADSDEVRTEGDVPAWEAELAAVADDTAALTRDPIKGGLRLQKVVRKALDEALRPYLGCTDFESACKGVRAVLDKIEDEVAAPIVQAELLRWLREGTEDDQGDTVEDAQARRLREGLDNEVAYRQMCDEREHE